MCAHGRSIPRRGYSISRETLEGRGRGPRFRGFYWAGKVVLVKVLSFLSREKKEEKEMPKERPRIDEDYRPRVSIVIQRCSSERNGFERKFEKRRRYVESRFKDNPIQSSKKIFPR